MWAVHTTQQLAWFEGRTRIDGYRRGSCDKQGNHQHTAATTGRFLHWIVLVCVCAVCLVVVGNKWRHVRVASVLDQTKKGLDRQHATLAAAVVMKDDYTFLLTLDAQFATQGHFTFLLD